jgi:WD40 repeat protein
MGQPDNPRKPPADVARSKAVLRAKLARQLDEPADLPLEPPSIPDHTLLRCIGEGAHGEVWLARNALGTLRAVKIVYRAWFTEDRPYDREFEGILKYEPISRTHENLVQVLHVGRNDTAGCFYYVMELADAVNEETHPLSSSGENLGQQQPSAFSADSYRPRTLRSELARRQRLPPTEAAQIALRLARALEFLHDQGLIHRDIKPSNVIFVSGQPKLADIGLVTNVGSSQSFVGTEGFIPPEGPGTPQADLYALGKLLYELATGRDRLDFPQLPSRVHQLPEGEALLELNEVVTRASAPNPAERYATATQLHAELDLFLAGRSLRRARNVERYLARVKQFAAVVCVLLALSAVALWYSNREARQALDRANSESALRQRAEMAERATEQQLYAALLEQARATVRSSDMGQRVRALAAIRKAAAISNSVEVRREVLSALVLPDLHFEREVAIGPENTIKWLDPKFERIAICRGRGPVEIRSVADERLLATLPASTNFMCYGVNWSPDGQFLAVRRDYPSTPDRSDVEVWKVDEGRRVLLIRDARFNARTWHPHKPQLLTGGADGWLSVWDVDAEKETHRQKFQTTPAILSYAPDGNRVAASYDLTNSGAVSIHSATNGAFLTTQIFTNGVSSLDWHPVGRWVAVTDYAGDVHLLDSQSGGLRTLGRHKAEAAFSLFSPDGNYLLTGGWEREFICWDLRTMERAMTIAADSFVAQFRNDGRACGLFCLGGMKLHSFEHPTAHRWFTEDLGPKLRHAAFSRDGRWLAASAESRVGVWDLSGNAPGALTDGVADTQLFWTQQGDDLFGSGRGEKSFRWRIQPATNAISPPTVQSRSFFQPDKVFSLTLTSNRIVWTGSKGSFAAGLEESSTGHEQWRNTIQGISGVSPDNRWLAVFRPYGTVLHVYGLPGLELVAQLTNQTSMPALASRPQVRNLVSGREGKSNFGALRIGNAHVTPTGSSDSWISG